MKNLVQGLSISMTALAMCGSAVGQTQAPSRSDQTPGETRINLEVSQPGLEQASAFRFVFSGDQTKNVRGGAGQGSNPFVNNEGAAKRTARTLIEFDKAQNTTLLQVSGDQPVRRTKPSEAHHVGYVYTGDYREIVDIAWVEGAANVLSVPDVACAFSYDRTKQIVRVVARNKSQKTVKISGAAFGVFTKFPALEELTSKNYPSDRLKAAPNFDMELPPGHQTPPLEVSMKPDEIIVSRAVIEFSGPSASEAFHKAGANNLSLWSFKPL